MGHSTVEKAAKELEVIVKREKDEEGKPYYTWSLPGAGSSDALPFKD